MTIVLSHYDITKAKLRKTWMITQAPQAKLNKVIKDFTELLSKEKNDAIQNYMEGLTPPLLKSSLY